MDGCATAATASSSTSRGSAHSIITSRGSTGSSSSREVQVQRVPLCGLVLTHWRLHPQLLEEGLVLQDLLLHVFKHSQGQQVRLLLLLQRFLQLR
jgi:hypothetical protein